jgi:ABC-type lipoprotein release transport system permease subunit
VELNLALLTLPLAVWLAGSLFAARIVGNVLARSQPRSSGDLGRPLPSLFRRSIGRRPWAIGNGAVVVSLIVALSTSLGVFTASYDNAKAVDARFANGSDIRITPSPASPISYTASDSDVFQTDGVSATTPVIYAVSNVILRSARTSDPANLAAIDPASFAAVAPVDSHATTLIRLIEEDPRAMLLSREMANFLKAKVGDPINVLLARATDNQVELEMRLVGIFERLPGFPDGADALINIVTHTESVPSKNPDFFLAATTDGDDATLATALSSLQLGPATVGQLQIDSRLTTLARDQSSLAALNIAGLIDLDSMFALAMVVVTIAVFVFGLLLQRRREYVTLRAQGLEPRTIRLLIAAEAGSVAVAGSISGVVVGAAMGFYFVTVLRPLFVLTPSYSLPLIAGVLPIVLVLVAATLTSLVGSRLVNKLAPTELLRDE